MPLKPPYPVLARSSRGAYGLVGAWPCCETLGNRTTRDVSGYGNNGTLQTSVNMAGGNMGGSLNIGGQGVDLGVASILAFTGTQPFSILAWIYARSLISDTSGPNRIFDKRGSSNTAGYYWGAVNSATWGANYLQVGVANANFNSATNVNAFNLNSWTHVGMTFSISGSTATVFWYVNGAVFANTGVSLSSYTDAGVHAWIGARSSDTARNWDGYIADVRVYNYVVDRELIALAYMGQA